MKRVTSSEPRGTRRVGETSAPEALEKTRGVQTAIAKEVATSVLRGLRESIQNRQFPYPGGSIPFADRTRDYKNAAVFSFSPEDKGVAAYFDSMGSRDALTDFRQQTRTLIRQALEDQGFRVLGLDSSSRSGQLFVAVRDEKFMTEFGPGSPLEHAVEHFFFKGFDQGPGAKSVRQAFAAAETTTAETLTIDQEKLAAHVVASVVKELKAIIAKKENPYLGAQVRDADGYPYTFRDAALLQYSVKSKGMAPYFEQEGLISGSREFQKFQEQINDRISNGLENEGLQAVEVYSDGKKLSVVVRDDKYLAEQGKGSRIGLTIKHKLTDILDNSDG